MGFSAVLRRIRSASSAPWLVVALLSLAFTAPAQRAKLPKASGRFTDASVGCATQDQAGNLWLGTNGEGLFRYDGKAFTQFTEQDGLSSRLVYSVLADRAGTLWVGTKTGLFRAAGKRFVPVQLPARAGLPFLNGLPASNAPTKVNGVWSMMQDRKGTIWFGADDGVYCYDGTRFTRFLDQPVGNPDSLHLRAIFSLLEDRRGNVWFASCIGEGLLRFDGTTLRRVSPKGYGRTQSLVEDDQGTIWFSSLDKGVCRYDGKTITTNFCEEPPARILLQLLKDRRGNLWICAADYNRELRVYDGHSCTPFATRHHFPTSQLFPLLLDRTGGVWLAARGMGLYRWDGQKLRNFSEQTPAEAAAN